VKAEKPIATYRRMRTEPLWKLLASDNAPVVIGLLQTHLYESERRLPASTFIERIERDLEELRAQGADLPQTAQAYIATWLAEGYLERRFYTGSPEEEYELSASAAEAVQLVKSIAQPHSTVTESRLSIVIAALVRLAEETDTNIERRSERLLAERRRIDKQLDDILQGKIHVLPDSSAVERIREILSLAGDLAGDFRRVRHEFEKLNRDLRQQLLESEGPRGDVLRSLFAGIDLIAESESGRTFSAFWRLLTDPEQAAAFDDALDDVMSRKFTAEVDVQGRRSLRRLKPELLEHGGQVHEVLQGFARSLRHFVQSREYLEQRRLNQLLKEAQRTALSLKDEVRATEALSYTLELTSGDLRSYSQWELYDPSLQASPEPMREGDLPTIDMESIGSLVAQSEINFRHLKMNVYTVLGNRRQASIGDVLEEFPAEQGLGSVVGLMVLGRRHGFTSRALETVAWVGGDRQERRAKIPAIYFVQEKRNEFV
jgi:hypothetical protein